MSTVSTVTPWIDSFDENDISVPLQDRIARHAVLAYRGGKRGRMIASVSVDDFAQMVRDGKGASFEDGRLLVRSSFGYVTVQPDITVAPLELKTEITEHDGGLETVLSRLLNRYGQEVPSHTPDFILARYLLNCLAAFNMATQQRDEWSKK